MRQFHYNDLVQKTEVYEAYPPDDYSTFHNHHWLR